MYWPTLVSGDTEMMGAFIDYLYKCKPVFESYASNRFNVSGSAIPETAFTYNIPAVSYNAACIIHHFAATVEYPLMMVRYYNISGDEERLKIKFFH